MKHARLHPRSVILGAGGFIGINLAKALSAGGNEVICFDRFVSPHWPRQTKVLTGDFSELPSDLLAMLDNVTVYHLISSCRPSQRTEEAVDEIESDVITTLRYLESTRKRNIRWIFVSSGGTVYGPDVAYPTTEDAPTNPICSYGLVKLTLEKYFALYGKLHETDFVVARVSNPYGPGQNPLSGQGIIASLIYKALKGQTADIWGDGKNVRDYLYIDDAVQALIALAKDGEGGEIYNVSSSQGTSINDLIWGVSEGLGLHLDTNYMAARTSDVRTSVLENKKLCMHTGWEPRVMLQEGLKLTADWIASCHE